MATTDELLDSAESEEENSVFEIDWDTREIAIPDSITLIGVENDKDSNRLYFKCPATYGEFSIIEYSLRVAFGNYNSSNSEQSADIYIVDDAESDGDYITFSWLVGENAYTTKGYVNFIVCCKYSDSDGNVVSDLNTTIASLPVLEGRDCNAEEIAKENYSDLYNTLVALQASLESATENAAEAAGTATEAATAANTATETANTATEAAKEAADSATEAANTAAEATETVLASVNYLVFSVNTEDNGLDVTIYQEEEE